LRERKGKAGLTERVRKVSRTKKRRKGYALAHPSKRKKKKKPRPRRRGAGARLVGPAGDKGNG